MRTSGRHYPSDAPERRRQRRQVLAAADHLPVDAGGYLLLAATLIERDLAPIGIGIQYAVTALFFLLFGFTLMAIMRWQLAYTNQPVPFIGHWLSQSGILDNKVSDFLKVLYDGGGIYSLGQQGTSLANGELIAGNVVFGKAASHGGNALYTDGGSRYVTLRGNAAFNNPPGRDGPGGDPYGHDWGGCRPYGDIRWTGNWWHYPARRYDCYPPYPPVNVTVTNNHLIPGPGGVPSRVLRNAGAH